jgi:hypothetical protein
MTNIDSAKTRGEYYARKFNKGNLAYRDINNTKLNPPFFPKIDSLTNQGAILFRFHMNFLNRNF